MMRIPSLLLASVIAVCAAQKPNIVFLFSDDHALQAITAYQGSRYAEHFQTPNIDRLAKEGAVFERSYCALAAIGRSRIKMAEASARRDFMVS